MSSRDYRSSLKKKAGIPPGNPFASAVAGFYTYFSHRKIIARSTSKEKLDALVMSIGNITFGGTGKTPHVEFFAKYLKNKNLKVGIA